MKRLLAIFLLVGGCLAGSAAATQFLAHRFGYGQELGRPLAVVDTVRVYPPHRWYQWRQQWRRHAPRPFLAALGMAIGGLIAGGCAAQAVGGGKRKVKPVGAFGTARWAEEHELEKAQLLDDRGVVLCQTADAVLALRKSGWRQASPGRLIRYHGEQHVLMFAPTGSGKGVGLVVPTLLSWNQSVVVYDTKRENWELSAGWRRKFSHVLRFEPTARYSLRFNPLMEVRAHPYDVADAQNIADILVNPDSMTAKQRDYWTTAGHAFLVGVILHVLYVEPDKSLGGVLKTLTDPDRDIDALLEAMLTTWHLPEGPHPVIAGGARAMLNKGPNERSGVVSTAESCLSLYRDPLVAANTAVSDFTIADLMCSERPVSLYLVVPPNDHQRAKPLVRLFLNFLGRRITEHTHHVEDHRGSRSKKHRLMYLIDEFPTLDRLPFFESQLAYLRGYSVQCVLIAQSLNQLAEAYGTNSSIMDNCHVRITYAANDERTAKRISDSLGNASLVREQISEGQRKGFLAKAPVTRTYQEYGRPLKTPEEIISLPYSQAILMVGNQRPYLAKKVLVYDDPRFTPRLGRAGVAQTGPNAPPETPAAQRRELPRSATASHWVTLPPPPVHEHAPFPPEDEASSEEQRDSVESAPSSPTDGVAPPELNPPQAPPIDHWKCLDDFEPDATGDAP